jgi:purine-binding chemotaxis protein CheW
MREPYIVFKVAGASYAVRSEWIKQVEMVENLTPVPNTPDYVEGVVYVRGQVVPVVNLRARFGMQKLPFDLYTRLIVISLNKRLIGLIVDSAREFMHLEGEDIIPPPDNLVGPGVEYLDGVISLNDRLILVINLHELFDSQEKKQLVNGIANGTDPRAEKPADFLD